MDKIFETNSFSCEILYYGKIPVSTFQQFFAVIEKKSFWEED